MKLNASGTANWAVKIGGSSADIGRAVGVDKEGNVYVAGTFNGEIAVSSTTLTSKGGTDIFICKYNNNGAFQWARSAGGGGAETLYDLAVDPNSGSVYLTGSITTHATKPVFGSIELTGNGSTDVFVCKLNKNGDFIWAHNYGGTGADVAFGVALQPGGNALVVTGHFASSVTFPGGTIATAAGASDIFVSKADTNGSYSWHKILGGKGADQARDVAVDANGNIYSTGFFTDSANFNPNGIYMLYGQIGYRDIYVSKLNSSGNFVYAGVIGGPMLQAASEEAAKCSGEAIVVDASGKAYVTGQIEYANVDFAPGSDVYNIRSKGNTDAFVLALTETGALSWVRTLGGTGADVGYGITLDNSGNVYTTGSFAGTAVFNADPTATTPSLTSSGGTDIFIHKMMQANCTSSLTPLIAEKGCDTFFFNGVAYTTSQRISGLLKNVAGCDSMVTIDLTISKKSTPSLFTPSVQCDSFEFDGVVYKQSGQYDHLLTNVAGCDSLVTLDLTIVQSSWDTIFRVSNCEGYSFEGTTYRETGFYVHRFTHSNGCDSNVVLSLTIDSINTSVTLDGTTLLADEANATWQWLDCDNHYAPIAGATDQSFVPEKDGHYAVAVTVDGCTDTSDCVTVVRPESVRDATGFTTWKLFPNPTQSVLHIDFSSAGSVAIYAIDGRQIVNMPLHRGINRVDLGHIQYGVYLVRIFDGAGREVGVQKLVREH